jgi:hypothetical protein
VLAGAAVAALHLERWRSGGAKDLTAGLKPCSEGVPA